MKILLAAYSANPYLGSEDWFSWSAIRCLAQDHELHILTSSRNHDSLARATAEGLIPPRTHFYYAGRVQPWQSNRLRARLQVWNEYASFMAGTLPVARELHQKLRFDLVHHLTAASWRVASPLWRLDIPFVFGPIGGNEQFPPRFLPVLSPAAAAFELLRMSSNLVSRLSPAVRDTIRRAAHIFAANVETGQLVKAIRGSGQAVSRLQPGFYSAATRQEFARLAAGKDLAGPLRLFAGGNMEGRKGVALALLALARARKNGVDFRYRIAAAGPEIPHLKKLAARLKLTREVIFDDHLQGDLYRQELGAAHIFLLPSFRESTGLTMMEAMLAGCVPVVADCGGPGFIVTEACGCKIPVVHREQMVADLAGAITAIDRDRKIISEKGRAAMTRIATDFSEENYRVAVNVVYRSLA